MLLADGGAPQSYIETLSGPVSLGHTYVAICVSRTVWLEGSGMTTL